MVAEAPDIRVAKFFSHRLLNSIQARFRIDLSDLEVDSLHISAYLLRYLFQHFLCKVTLELRLRKSDKLNNIAFCDISPVVSEHLSVTVQLFHKFKVMTSHTNNDD